MVMRSTVLSSIDVPQLGRG